jgi:hypothetical protein
MNREAYRNFTLIQDRPFYVSGIKSLAPIITELQAVVYESTFSVFFPLNSLWTSHNIFHFLYLHIQLSVTYATL